MQQEEEIELIKGIAFSLEYRMFENCILLCQELFQNKKDPKILNYYAKAYINSGSPYQAVMLCRQYEHIVFSDPDLLFVYAQAFFESGKYIEAGTMLNKIKENYEKTISNDLLAATEFYLGLVMTRTHRFDVSKSHFQAARYIHPIAIGIDDEDIKQNSSPSSPNTSTISPRPSPKPLTEKQMLAPKQLRAKQSKKPKYCATMSFIRHPSRVDDLNKASHGAMSDSIISMKTKGWHLFRCSKYTEAKEVFENLVTLHPYSMLGLDVYSTCLWQLKDEKNLSNLVKRTMEIAPNRPETWIAAGNLLSLQHNSESAVSMFQRAANIDKSCSYALALAGHELILLGSVVEAAKLFRESIDRNPNEWTAWYGLGTVYFKEDNFGAARYYMKKALEINPYSSVLHYIYAMVLRKGGQEEAADAEFDAAIELEPTNLIPLFQKGILLNEQGDAVEALACLDAAEALAPHEPAIALYRGKIAESLGDAKGAAEMYTNALIYGYPDKKEIHASMEKITDAVIAEFLEH